MIFEFWLIVNDVGGSYARKNRPSLAEGEVGIPITLNVPDAWFSRQTPVTSISIPEPQFPAIAIEAGEVQP